MSTGFITLPAHRYDRVTRPMTDDPFGPTVEVELAQETILDLRHAAYLFREQLEESGQEGTAADMERARDALAEPLEETIRKED